MSPTETNQQQEILPNPISTPAEMPQAREYQKTTSELLTQIKTIYESWPTEEYGVTFKQALHIFINDCPTSRLVDDSNKLEAIKKIIPSFISQQNNFRPEKLALFSYVTDFDPETLKLIDDPSNGISANILKQISAQNPGPENQQKRQEIIQKITEGQNYSFGKQFKPIKSRETSEQQVSKKIETPIVNFSDRSFIDQAQTAQALQDEYKKRKRGFKNIGFQKAIKLIHKQYSNSEPKPNGFDPKTKQRLIDWFQEYLPKSGINNIDEIDYDSFFPFVIANPTILPFFNKNLPGDILSESMFRSIVIKFPNELNFEIQELITKFVMKLPSKDRFDTEKIESFLEKCKHTLTHETDRETQITLIEDIYENRERKSLSLPNQTRMDKSVQPEKKSTQGLENKPSPEKDLEKGRLARENNRLDNENGRLTEEVKRITNNFKRYRRAVEQSGKILIDEWWLDPKFKIPQIEQEIMSQIFSGEDPFEIAEKNKTTVENVYAKFISAFSRRHHLNP